MRKQALFGLIIAIIGLNILFNLINVPSGSLVAPLIFFVLGVYFYQKKHRFLSVFFFILAASTFFDRLLGMNLIGFIIAIVALYYGIRLVKGQGAVEKKEKRRGRRKRESFEQKPVPMTFSELGKAGEEEKDEKNASFTHSMEWENGKREYMETSFRHSWIGDVHYIGEAFELNDITIWNGLGDVRFDLSKAIIPEGETVIIVHGIIGQIDFYVPDDLALSVQAATLIGEISLYHEKYGGFNRKLGVATIGYKEAPRRVKLILSTMIGEVKVREV